MNSKFNGSMGAKFCATLAVLFPAIARAVTLQTMGGYGFASSEAPIPLNHSNAMVLQAPLGRFYQQDIGGPANTPFYTTQPTLQNSVTPDDSTLLLLTETTFEAIRISDGAVLHSINSEGWKSYSESFTGKYLILFSRYLSRVTVIRESDFAAILSMEIPEARPSFLGARPAFAIDETTQELFVAAAGHPLFKINLATASRSPFDFVPKELFVLSLAFDGTELHALSGSRYIVGATPSDDDQTYFVEYHDYFAVEKSAGIPRVEWTTDQPFIFGPIPRSIGLAPPVVSLAGGLSTNGNYLLEGTTVWKMDTFGYTEWPDAHGIQLSQDGRKVGVNQAIPRRFVIGSSDTGILNNPLSLNLDYVESAGLNGPDNSMAVYVNKRPAPQLVGSVGQDLCTLSQLPEGDSYRGWIPGTPYLLKDGASLLLWNTETCAPAAELFKTEGGPVTILDIASDGSQIAFSGGASNNVLYVRNTSDLANGVETGGFTITGTGEENQFAAALLGPSGDTIYAVTKGSVKLYSSTGDILATESVFPRCAYYDLAYLSDGRILCSSANPAITIGIGPSNIRTYDPNTLSTDFVPHFSDRNTMQLSNQVGQVIVAKEDNVVRMIDVVGYDIVASFTVQNLPDIGNYFAFQDEGARFVIAQDGGIVYYSTERLKFLAARDKFLDPGQTAEPIDQNEDGILDVADFKPAESDR
ncbi:MAG: hypothetical protein ABI579_06980 [Candidatus Sumerlaeota bacterium]